MMYCTIPRNSLYYISFYQYLLTNRLRYVSIEQRMNTAAELMDEICHNIRYMGCRTLMTDWILTHPYEYEMELYLRQLAYDHKRVYRGMARDPRNKTIWSDEALNRIYDDYNKWKASVYRHKYIDKPVLETCGRRKG